MSANTARPDVPRTMRDRLETYAQYALRGRSLLRLQYLVVAIATASLGLLVAEYVGGSAGSAVGGGFLVLTVAFAYIAVLAPDRWLGPSDPIVDLVPGEEELWVLTRSGASHALRWDDPAFRLVLEDYSETRDRLRDVVRVVVGPEGTYRGGVNRDDADALAAAARRHRLARDDAHRTRGVLRQRVLETTLRPRGRTAAG